MQCMSFTVHMIKSGEKWPTFFKELEGKNFTNDLADFVVSLDGLKSQTASAFSKASARGCAKLANIFANKGEGFISDKTWNEMHSEPLKETGMVLRGKDITILF